MSDRVKIGCAILDASNTLLGKGEPLRFPPLHPSLGKRYPARLIPGI